MKGPQDLSLAEYQETALRLFFAPEVDDAELGVLGPPERWRIYRNMVRARLEKVIHAALPGTLADIGEDATRKHLAAFFAEAPPTTRWFREIPEQFGAFLEGRLPAEPPHAADRLRFELAKWAVQHLEATPAREVIALDFEREPAVTPALRRFHVDHRVDRVGPKAREVEAASARLAVYRRLDDKPSTWVMNDIAADLLDAFAEGEGTLAERVQAVTKARGTAIDAAFLDGLGTLLADFLERGVLLGSFGS